MFVAQGTSQTVESVQAVIVLAATMSVIFWRLLLKIAVIVMLALLVYGAILIFQSIHYVAT
jgi:hypothetical protein